MNVQLIDTETGGHLWAERFETDRENLVEAEDEIIGRLARTLNLELVEAVGRRIEQEEATDPDARDLGMRGWALFIGRSTRRLATTCRRCCHGDTMRCRFSMRRTRCTRCTSPSRWSTRCRRRFRAASSAGGTDHAIP